MFAITKTSETADAIRAALSPAEIDELMRAGESNVVAPPPAAPAPTPEWEWLGPITADAVRSALNALGVSVRLNLIGGRIEIDGLGPKYSNENAPEVLLTIVRDFIIYSGFKTSYETVSRGLAAAADVDRFNPVEDLLKDKAEPWDGRDRFPELCAILGIGAGALDAVLVLKWLHQCIALALNDEAEPYGADGVLVLQGPQGCGKTQFFRKLAMKSAWFAEGATIDVANKDSLIRATGAWIVELGELDATLKREQSALKAFLTAAVDEIRPPYGRIAVRRPRRASFAATVNPSGFLVDESGSRRFWVIHVDKIDLARLDRLDVPQLWRQAYAWFLRDPQGFRLSSAERAQLEARNRDFDRAQPFEEELRRALDWNLPLTSWRWTRASTLKNLVDVPANTTAAQLGRALTAISEDATRRLESAGIASPKVSRTLHGIREYLLPLNRP